MSDHPLAGFGVGGLERQVRPHGRAQRADAVLDVRRAHAVGGLLAVDDVGAVDAAGGDFARHDRLRIGTRVDRVLDVERPVIAGPPGDRAGLEVVAGDDPHAAISANWATATSSREVTSPMTISAGLFTRCCTTRSGRAARGPRSTRIEGRAAFSITASGMSGARPSAISFSAICGAVFTPI